MKENEMITLTKDEIKSKFDENQKQWLNKKEIESIFEKFQDSITFKSPKKEDIFKAFSLFEPSETRVLILGQDPYPEKSKACGLAFLHNETYHVYSAKDIDKYYSYKEALDENKEFVKVNGKETLAQIFTDIRYTKKDNELMSASMLETLRNQGFM